MTDEDAQAADEAANRAADGHETDDDDASADPDDVEADLDTILKDRIAAEETEDEAAKPTAGEQGAGAGRVQPMQPDEFVCQSCFLVKHPSQLADVKKKLCSDCV